MFLLIAQYPISVSDIRIRYPVKDWRPRDDSDHIFFTSKITILNSTAFIALIRT